MALAQACRRLAEDQGITNPFGRLVAAVSVGVIDGESRLDLDYDEDRTADVDANIVMLEDGEFVEVQATGEQGTFGRPQLDSLLDLGRSGIEQLLTAQRALLQA